MAERASISKSSIQSEGSADHRYDVIVVGTGGIGSATVYELARRGARVLGIDAHFPPHDQGSSHGQTRMIRQAYFEHPDYVPLVLAAYPQWRELEQMWGRPLLIETGLLEVGPSNGIVVPGVLEAARRHNLEVEAVDSAALASRFSDFNFENEDVGVFEPRAGILLVEACVRAHLELAQQHGGKLLGGTTVDAWTADRSGISVHAGNTTYHGDRLILTAGPFVTAVARELPVALEVRRKAMFWFDAPTGRHRIANGSPAYFFETPQGYFYGLPDVDGQGVKVCEHSGGQAIADPTCVERSVRRDDLRRVTEFIASRLVDVDPLPIAHSVCLYTMTPDEHFVIDRHPESDAVWMCCGLSGHGFKFAPAIAMALADFSLRGATELPIGFLSLERFLESDPTR